MVKVPNNLLSIFLADFSVDKALSNMKTCLTQRKVKEEVFGEMDFTKVRHVCNIA